MSLRLSVHGGSPNALDCLGHVLLCNKAPSTLVASCNRHVFTVSMGQESRHNLPGSGTLTNLQSEESILASLMAQRKELSCQCRRCRFDPWVRKILWRRKWQPAPVFLPGKSHGQRNMVGHRPQESQRGVAKSWTPNMHALFTSLLAAFLLFETLNCPCLPFLPAESSVAHPISLMAVLPR